MQSEIGSNETCARGCPRIQAQDCVGYASKEIRFERERERKRERENRLRLNGASTRVTFIGRMRATIWSAGGKDCGGWFAGRLHNAILRHNDCNALMHFRTVHWVADWRCFESLFSRLHESGLARVLSISLSLSPFMLWIAFRICPRLNNAHKSRYHGIVFDRDITHCLLEHCSSFCYIV